MTGIEIIIYASLGAVAGMAAGFFVGRFTGRDASRQRALEEQLESEHKNAESALAELDVARDELTRVRRELETTRKDLRDYRESVVDHFVGTSELLRDMTARYRAVYDHVRSGAELLCPEGTLTIEEAPLVAALPQAHTAPEPLETDADDRPDEDATEGRDPGAREDQGR